MTPCSVQAQGAVEEAHAQHVINAEHLDLTATNIVQY